MNPKMLSVFQSPFPKLRLGKNNDGGYILVDLPGVNYTTFISGGIANDISFEVAFITKYPNVKTYAFDGTIDALPQMTTNTIQFIKKNIGFETNAQETNIHDIIDAHNSDSIFVKMDIEGGEIPWIKSLNDQQMNKFEQIVMEFHSPFSDNEIDVFAKLNKFHILVHFHGNNCGGTRVHQGIVMPNVFECTYLHKKYFFRPPRYNSVKIPSSLDMRNSEAEDEIFIDYAPFVIRPARIILKKKHGLSIIIFSKT